MADWTPSSAFRKPVSEISGPEKGAEILITSHLLKAVEGWTGLGLGTFELRYLRDKQQPKVDFLVVRDRNPWFLVDVKASGQTLSQRLK